MHYSLKYYTLLFVVSLFPLRYLQSQVIDKSYNGAFLSISSMLSGDAEPNFKKAIFLTEKAYSGGMLNEKVFDDNIGLYTSICKNVMASGNIEYAEKDKDIAFAQCAVFMFMTDSIPIIMSDSTIIGSIPFEYNHEDFAGQKDWSNMFVSALMETNTGNCHSMPYLYKMIMDELGYQSHLALAPNHIYIKVQNKRVGWYNIEQTCADFSAN